MHGVSMDSASPPGESFVGGLEAGGRESLEPMTGRRAAKT